MNSIIMSFLVVCKTLHVITSLNCIKSDAKGEKHFLYIFVSPNIVLKQAEPVTSILLLFIKRIIHGRA